MIASTKSNRLVFCWSVFLYKIFVDFLENQNSFYPIHPLFGYMDFQRYSLQYTLKNSGDLAYQENAIFLESA